MSRKQDNAPMAQEAGKGNDKVSVYFDTPGIVRIGPYQRMTAYEVEAEEAERLVKVKGFQRGTPPQKSQS